MRALGADDPGEHGLFERASGTTLWLALVPPMAWVVAGLFGWRLRPASLTGPLMTAVGLSFFLASVPFTAEPLPFTVAMLLWGAPFAFAIHMYLVFPGDRGARERGDGDVLRAVFPCG